MTPNTDKFRSAADLLHPEQAQPPHGSGPWARIRNYFLTGLVVAGPLAITAYLTWSFVTWVDDLVRPFIPVAYRPETYLPVPIPGTGLIVAVVVLTLLGFFTANLVGRTLVEAGEHILGRMPIVRAVYKSLKQIFETLFSKSGTSFRKVGLVEFPAPGMWSMVFLSSPPSEEVHDSLPSEEEYVSVFLPCTPNPTTGFFFYVKRAEVLELDVTPESAATLIMSAGLIQPKSDPNKRLAALAEATGATETSRSGVTPPTAPVA